MSDAPIVAIADDDPITREALATALSGRYELRLFEGGQALLDGIAADPVDLVVLDVAMPGLDGYDTCRALRAGQVQPDVPVIFLSGRAHLEDRLSGYAAGGNDYFTKPYDIAELHAKILLAIDSHRREQRLAGEVVQLGQAVSATAEMIGEVGVVLEFHRCLTACRTPACIADAIAEAMVRLGIEGCMRLKSRRSTITRSLVGWASALEASLLDHLESLADARIVTMGHNLGFSFGTVTLLARNLAWATAPDAAETIDAIGRARDNTALLAEGAVAQLRAIDAEQDARQLLDVQELLKMTREALQELTQTQRQIHVEIDAVFEAIRDEFEMRFPQLGLTTEQEDHLADMLSRHRSRGLAVLARGRLAEDGLRRVVERLERSPHAAPAARA